MKKLYFSILLLLTIGTISAQEQLSTEEKARREKNIEAGNPFKQFGYKAKVATLSKGKYLEVHDLDSIVVIGSVRFHVDKKEIVGFVEPDTINGMYARPIGDMPSRWLSPDPLAEEFTSWSPYTMSFDNPIQFVDPDGRAADDWRNTKGQLVYDPSANGGKGDYTKHATAQERKFGDALRSSGEKGAEQFNTLVTSETKTTVEFHNGDSGEGQGYLMGETTYGKNNEGIKVQSDGSVKVSEAKIDIYRYN